MYCFFYTLAHMRLADAVLLNYSLPLFMPFVESAWLGEEFPRRLWTPVLVGFVGLIVILRPGEGLIEPVALRGRGLRALRRRGPGRRAAADPHRARDPHRLLFRDHRHRALRRSRRRVLADAARAACGGRSIAMGVTATIGPARHDARVRPCAGGPGGALHLLGGGVRGGAGLAVLAPAPRRLHGGGGPARGGGRDPLPAPQSRPRPRWRRRARPPSEARHSASSSSAKGAPARRFSVSRAWRTAANSSSRCAQQRSAADDGLLVGQLLHLRGQVHHAAARRRWRSFRAACARPAARPRGRRARAPRAGRPPSGASRAGRCPAAPAGTPAWSWRAARPARPSRPGPPARGDPVRRRCGVRRRRGGASRYPAPEDGLELLGPDGLGDVVVHPRGQAPLAVAHHRARGEGDDRRVPRALPARG